jgi:hypothetical protein
MPLQQLGGARRGISCLTSWMCTTTSVTFYSLDGNVRIVAINLLLEVQDGDVEVDAVLLAGNRRLPPEAHKVEAAPGLVGRSLFARLQHSLWPWPAQ